MLQKQIVCILTFFDMFGYDTGFSPISTGRKSKLFILFVNILFATLFTLYEFCFIIELLNLVGILDTINELIQYSAALCTYWLIILDSILYRREHKTFWNNLERINGSFCSQCLSLQNYLWYSIECILISTILYMCVYATNVFPSTMFSNFVFLILILVWQIRLFYYILCLEIVYHQLKTISNEISIIKSVFNVAGEGNCVHTSKMDSCEFEGIRRIQEYYYCVNTMMDILNVIFSWSQPAVILFCLYSVVTDLNWLYSTFDKFTLTQIICKHFFYQLWLTLIIRHSRPNKINILVISTWIGHLYIGIFYLFRAVNNCYNAVSFFCENLNNQ